MPAILRILLIEDSPEDAQLLALYLEKAGVQFTCQREESLAGFHSALNSGPWDLVLCDFSLPGTDGLEILGSLRTQDPDLPFILLSGVLDEGAAVAAMRSGANDFILKGNLSRLVPAIEREMKEAGLRRKQRRFESELRLLHTAIGQTPDLVLITDSEGRIQYVNAAAEAITGYQRDELIGQNPRLFKSDRHDEGFYRSMWETLLSGETWKGHIVNRRKDGTLWDAESVISPVLNAQGGLHYLFTARDATLERQLQGLLEQSQRLETIGTLTSGIAHDFNNILMPLLGHAELGLARPPGDPKVKHDLEVIQASANRAKDLIRQILTFSRRGEGELIAIDLQGLLSESFQLLRTTLPTSVTFNLGLEAKGIRVKGDPTQLQQVILNLCTNASHAMQGRAGCLTVRLYAARLDALTCAMGISLPEGDYLCLEVTDTGRGILPGHLEKVFTPFFTTKPPREGTGLGLSVTLGIVCTMGGGIQVESQVGVGTTFKVFLPVAPAGTILLGPENMKLPIGHGHLLLVDDEESLLDMLQASLTRMGFRISSFLDPGAALQAFLEDPCAFQAVVTDHTMPGLCGLRLAQAIWKVKPDLPILLLSGDPNLEKTNEAVRLAGFRACLAKPMSPRDLAKAILKWIPELEHPVQEVRS